MYLLFEIANYICILFMHTLYMQLFSFKLAWLWILGTFPAEKNLNNSVFFKWFLKLFSPKHFAILKYVLLFCLLRKCLSVAYFVPKSARFLLTSSLGYHHSLFLFVILKWYHFNWQVLRDREGSLQYWTVLFGSEWFSFFSLIHKINVRLRWGQVCKAYYLAYR